ncbi:MAG TPA: DUF1801 domain-containing protein [Acidimicrobiia bacterium]|nr:DUF1801 domain-containing protein [Acidimicrobiia bacterium]
MYGHSDAKTTAQYIAGLPEPRRGDVAALHKLIRTTVPGLKPTMALGYPGYGLKHYKYASGREGDWPVVGLANNKQYISLYVTAVKDGHYLAETYARRLGKASCGKSCIRFKRLSDLNLEAVKELLGEAAVQTA